MTRIVVPTDFSAAAHEAAAYAAHLAGPLGAEVHLLHVLSWPDAGTFDAAPDGQSATAEEQEEEGRAQGALAEAARQAFGDAPVVLAVERSRAAAPAVVAYAARVEADLIVAGMHGQRGPNLLGLGGTAGEVIQTATCDVLLVPLPGEAPFSTQAPQRVLVPVDFSSASPPLVAFALGLAARLSVTAVDLVHVLAPLPYPVRWVDQTILDLVPTIRERAAAALSRLSNEAAPTVQAPLPEVSLYVERGKPAPTLIRAASALHSDLMVVGPHAERPVFDRLLGSVAESLARRAPCPVLVARRSGAPPVGAVDVVDRRSYESSVVEAAPPV